MKITIRWPGARQLLLAALLVSLPKLAAAEESALLERGEYLAIAGNCAACHTAKGGEPYAGGVGFETPFGRMYSTNITPDPVAGIGGWSELDFRTALRRGIRKDGEHLYPVFPYTAYTKLSDADISALYAYFQSVPAVDTKPQDHALRFPFNQRLLLGAWKALYFSEERHLEDASESKEWNRGAYLVEALGHCSACHTPRNWLGAEIKSLAYSGGEYLDKIQGGELRQWFAVDLTGAPQGLQSWSTAQLEQYLKHGLNDYATTFGPMNKVVEGSTRHLSDADIHAMATYIKALPASAAPSPAEPDKSVTQKGAALYAIHCATCHLPTGKGSIETGPSMIGNPVVLATNPSSLINSLLHGPELPQMQLPVQRTRMDGYASLLTDSEIAAIATYMRSAWGNRAATVSPEQVAVQR